MKLDRLIAKFKKFKTRVNLDLNSVCEDLDSFEVRLEALEAKPSDDITQRLDEHEGMIQSIGNMVGKLDARIFELERKFQAGESTIRQGTERISRIEAYKNKLDDELQSISRFESDISSQVEAIHKRIDVNTTVVTDDLEETKAALRHAQAHIESLQLSLNNCVAMISELQEFNKVETSLEVCEQSNQSHGFTATFTPNLAEFPFVETVTEFAKQASDINHPMAASSKDQLIDLCLQRKIQWAEFETWEEVADEIIKYDSSKVAN